MSGTMIRMMVVTKLEKCLQICGKNKRTGDSPDERKWPKNAENPHLAKQLVFFSPYFYDL